MINNLTAEQQKVYNKYLDATKAAGGSANVGNTQLFWGADGSLKAKESDGDVFEFSADGTLISKTEGKKEADETSSTTKSDLTISSKEKDSVIAELKAKYSATEGGNDPYTMSNPQLQAFKQAMDDGLISELNKQGFAKNDIIDIISQVFPSIGISVTENGGYTLPYGHDEDAKELYDLFKTQIGQVANTSPEIEALKTSIAGLENQIAYNNNQLSILEKNVEALKEEIEELIDQAIDESEEIAEEQKEEAKKIVAQELDNYTSAKGAMTYEEFQSNLAGRLDSLDSSSQSKLSSITIKLLNAESKMSSLNGYLTQMNSLQNTNSLMQEQIGTKTVEMESLQAQMIEENANCEDDCCQRTDPIGFETDGKKYDFFVDKDDNGLLSNEQEFLGAQDGWQEMAALDTNGDGKVDKSELEESDLKVVVTDESGKQSVADAADIFGDEDSIDLNSYNELNQEMDNGNALLGTFGLTFGGEKIEGYNTLDTLDWLDDNYEFSDKDMGIGRFAQSETIVQDDQSSYFAQMISQFNQEYENLELKLEGAWSTIGVSRDEVTSAISEQMRQEAQEQAEKLEDQLAKYDKEKDEPQV